MTPEQIAEHAAQTMWKEDKASQGLNMQLVSCTPGQAIMTMRIDESMVNGHESAHGGFIFSLADSTFAFACNSYGDVHVAAQCQITYIRPAKLGDVLTAEAIEISKTGRNGIYDVRVHVEGRVIAQFRGHSRALGTRFI